MKKLLFLLLSILSLTTYADDVVFPDWFLHPSAHTFVGISEPNDNVHDAINTALIHYLICSDFSGKMNLNIMTQSSKDSMESNTESLFKLDTTLYYSLEEIVSISNHEYVCRISDRPDLSRRIILWYYVNAHSRTTKDKDTSDLKFSFECLFEDHNGKSMKKIIETVALKNGDIIERSYSSHYMQEDIFATNYHNLGNNNALGEQVIDQYLNYLTKGFMLIKEGEDNAYHKATPFSGFKYNQGYITIIP